MTFSPEGLSPARILLVDDQPANLLVLKAVLEGLDLVLVEAYSGPEALERLSEQDVAAVLLDVQMPGMDGFETARRIRSREENRHTPILFQTAFDTDRAVVEQAYALGAVDFLVKPLMPVVLRAKVMGFVELFRYREENKRQAELLRKAERRDFERRLADENARLQVSLAKEKRANQRLATQYAVTRALAESAALDAAGPRILRAVCEHLQWNVGALWYVDAPAGVLRCATLWHMPSVEVPRFEETSRQRTFEPGIGLPGRVWASQRAAWIPDVVQDSNFPRAPIADKEGLHGAFGFPVVLNGDVLGVIEFFSHEIRQPDEDLLQMMTVIGAQIGQFMDRKRAEQALREADRRKDEFLATLAHELRNPLASICNAIELTKRAVEDELVEQARGMMERQVAQMVRLVDDLLDVGRITRGKIQLRKERLELAAVIHGAVEGTRPLVESQAHELTVALPPQPIYVDADPVRLGQVISNLLNNAAKYTEKRGRIWLTARRDGNSALICVRDTGIGIDPKQLPHIFEMFAQVEPALDRSQGGLGIGLSLVKGLVELHGGTIEAQSGGAGQGSEFLVRLPISASPDPARREAGAASPQSHSNNRRRILVVDDNRDAADSLAMMLRVLGHHTQTAYDGQAAVESAAAFAPDIVLLDIGLPKLNGYQAARQIRGQPWGQAMALIAITGWGQEEDKRRALEAGFDHHLTKPVEAAVLQELLTVLKPT
jgi:signal transduction histidine kinase/DNA-binding response OmpR family regulator